MEDYSTSTDPTQQLNSLFGGGSGEPLIPESMMTFIIISFVLINILTLVFLIMWIANMVRRWKVQTAVLHMQKDIADIKDSLAKQAQPAPAAGPIFNEPQKPELKSEKKILIADDKHQGNLEDRTPPANNQVV